MSITPTQPLPSHAARTMRQAASHAGSAAADLQTAAKSAVGAGIIPGTPEHRRAEHAQAHEDVMGEKPGFATRMLDRLSSIGGMALIYDFAALMGLSAVTGALSKGLDKVGMTKASGWFERRSKSLQGQRKFLETTEVHEGLTKTAEAVHARTVRAFGEESMLARGMGGVAEGAAVAQRTLNEGAAFVGEKTGTALGGLAEMVRPELDAVAALHGSRAARHFTKIGTQMDAASAALATHGEALAKVRLGKESKPMQAASSFVTGDAESGALRTAEDHIANIRTNFAELKNTLAAVPTAEGAQRATALLAEVRGDMSAVRTLHAGDAALKQAGKEVGGALAKLERPLGAMAGNLQKASRWASMPDTLKNLPEALGKTDLHQALFAGTIGAQTLAETAHTGFSVKHDLHVLKAMVEAVEGKPATTLHVLTGDIPPMLKEARHHFFGKHKPEVIAEAIGGMAALAFLKKAVNPFSLPLMAGMAAPQVGRMLADQNQAIAMYEGMTNVQNAGQNLTPDVYAGFVHALVEDTNTLDLSKYRPEARDKLFTEYAQKNTSVDQVLRDMGNGAMESRIKELEASLPKEEMLKQPVGQHTAKVLERRAAHVVHGASAHAAQHEEKAPAAEVSADVPASTISHVAAAERLHQAPSHAMGGAA